MTNEPEVEPDEIDDEEEDECAGDNHSWEYLYSVSECARCKVTVVDD